ncbi:lytic murein transglycosylase [Litoreibacter ascidiaceicola]|uniref:Lytic murein transglycosylase n=1 Tax=Litoreibacter ascidiaceicola TaxID=1486859 RepID=A0A1M5B220_9RHOB|nr:lytic murein transglycosylase [Litoreibacter ascidiaceicola]SHF36470.1 lytic murein transglycosylase [Litoreibacter ascidiaceicola]
MRILTAITVAICMAQGALAEGSKRPILRPAFDVPAVQAALVIPPTSSRLAVERSLRPRLRGVVREAAPAEPAPVDLVASNARFQAWIKGFRPRALANGISGATFDQAFQGVRYDADVIKRDRNQSEFTKTLWDYLDSAASDVRIANGKAAVAKHRSTLDRIEARYGVDKEVVAAVWGLESAYGTFRGSKDLVGSLATLAFDARRGAFFEQQLIAGLKILQSGDVAPRSMTGSWAGAMGHTQFIPTSYLDYAVDFTGDGKRDIWGDDPTDALASTANYLAKFGWVKGQPWGVEVTLPQGFDYALANRKILKSPAEWGALGIKGLNGQNVTNHGQASILLPAGAKGAAFMIFKNFSVIERYNTADAYVIGVGHLSDRLKGKPAIRSGWPRGDRALKFAERKEMQRLLTAKGFDTKKIDGKIGPLTIEAVRGFQRSVGLVPDGYASLDILKRLR